MITQTSVGPIDATDTPATRPSAVRGSNVPSKFTVSRLPGFSRSPHSASTPVIEMLTSVASTPWGEMGRPVIDGTAEAGYRPALRASRSGEAWSP